MVDFNSVLSDAQQLTESERMRLIDALWTSVPEDADIPLHEDWGPELERRVASIQSDSSSTIAWETIRREALSRIGHGS